MSGRAEDIFNEIKLERERQIEKWGEQHHPDGTSLNFVAAADDAKRRYESATVKTWQMILDEEVLEAFSEADKGDLRAELVQVAAVCVAWLEDIDSRKAADPAAGPWKGV